VFQQNDRLHRFERLNVYGLLKLGALRLQFIFDDIPSACTGRPMQRIQTIVQRIADADFLKSVIGHMPFAAFISSWPSF